jgi:UDP-hydrolysing UDP-N-acetyl-D-glucosamine 2-epimerase
MLSTAISASHLSIPIAHISGGDVTQGGMIDDKVRNAISMFSDIHFPTCQVSYDNLKKMLPNNSKIYLVGNPGIPTDYELTNIQTEQIAKKYNVDINKPIIIVLQHPVTSQDKEAFEQMASTMDAIVALQQQTIVIYPNSDAGSDEMIICINAYRHIPYIQVYKSIPNEDFKALMKISNVIVGNSSCALLEAPSFGLWAVDIGDRQKGREQSTNVIHTTHDSDAIITAIRVALSAKKKHYTNPYAQKNSEDKIIRILKEVL